MSFALEDKDSEFHISHMLCMIAPEAMSLKTFALESEHAGDFEIEGQKEEMRMRAEGRRHMDQ
ncbi:MAG: hypothetical protein ACLPTZ_05780 [Beijerinckiaceae bacterium]